jgi:geranylgeranyl reductase family protein
VTDPAAAAAVPRRDPRGPTDLETNANGRRHIDADVVVVGGGPAGSAAAIELGRSGRSAVLIDKAVFPRDKCCGDGLTTLALRELELLGFEPADVPDWFDVSGARLRSPSGREVELPLPDHGRYAAVAPRLQLDDALLTLARTSGVAVHDGQGFDSLEQSNDSVVVRTPELSIRARYVVAADGMWSPVRRALDLRLPGYLGDWHGFRQYASGVSGPARDHLYVWFEPDLVPGYAWSFPLPGGRVNIGLGVLRDGERRIASMAQLWLDLLERPHVVEALGSGFQLEDRHLAWPIPARIDEVTIGDGRTLFVGDAAAATDVMTGEGIGQALLTGRLAAEAIIGAGALQPGTAMDIYRREVEHHLRADHRMSKLLGSMLGSELGARAAVRVVGASGTWGRRNFARWMFEDEPRAVLLTPTRWHRQFLGRAGAYASGAPGSSVDRPSD